MILLDLAQRGAFNTEFARVGGWRAGGAHEDGAPLDAILGTLEDERFPGAVLPRVWSDGQLQLYAVAQTTAQWRELAPLVKAFVGVTASDFRGSTTPLDEADPLERWLAKQGLVVARFSAGADRPRQRLVLAGLQRLRETLGRSEAPQRAMPRSTVQVLRDFNLALSGRDREEAEAAIAFLRDNMRLDALNLRSLEVQVEAAFERWDVLRGHPSFPTLVQARRSTRLTAALVEALYWTEVRGYEAAANVDGALAAFRTHVRPASGTLFRVPPPLPRPRVATAFVLAALTQDLPDWDAAARVAASAQPGSATETAFREALLARRPTQQVAPPLPAQVSTWEDLEAQLSAAEDEKQPTTIKRALGVLVAATELGTLAAYRTAVRYVGRLDEQEREHFLNRRAASSLWAEISAHQAGDRTVPQNWIEWLDALPSMDFAQARAVADAAAHQWPIREQLSSARSVQLLADRLLSAPEDEVAEAVPFLLEWLRTDPDWPNAAQLPIFEALFTLLVIGARRTPAALAAVTQVLDAQLAIGLSPATYRLVLRDLADLVPKAVGTRTLDWLLDTLEVVVTHPAADRPAMEGLWDAVLGTLQPLASRFEVGQLEVMADLARIVGRSSALAAIGSAPVASEVEHGGDALADQLVAIYTLTEEVGRRVKQALQAEFPRVRCELLHDLVNSPRLADLAKRADLFVVCWQSAKHAAKDAIKQARPVDRPTLFPTGRGSSSISREIREFAAQSFGSLDSTPASSDRTGRYH